MPDNMLDEMEFEKRLKEMPDRQLLEFVAHQTYEVCRDVTFQEKRIMALENINKKYFGITGGISAIIGGAIIAVINYFFNKN